MTAEQIKSLRLGIEPIDDRTILNCEAGLEWVKNNTTLEFDMNNDEDLKALPSAVRLFLVKFNEIQAVNVGIASESIEGLSQSFSQTTKESMIWDAAAGLLYSYLKSGISFIPAQRKWL